MKKIDVLRKKSVFSEKCGPKIEPPTIFSGFRDRLAGSICGPWTGALFPFPIQAFSVHMQRIVRATLTRLRSPQGRNAVPPFSGLRAERLAVLPETANENSFPSPHLHVTSLHIPSCPVPLPTNSTHLDSLPFFSYPVYPSADHFSLLGDHFRPMDRHCTLCEDSSRSPNRNDSSDQPMDERQTWH